MSTDYCDYAGEDCGVVKVCDPSVRIPKRRQVRHKRLVEGVRGLGRSFRNTRGVRSEDPAGEDWGLQV